MAYMFTEVEFLRRFERAAKAGFKGVEMIIPYNWSKEQIAEQVYQNNLEVVLFLAPAGDFKAGERGIASYPDRVKEFRQGIDLAIEYAKELNCSLLNVLVGLERPDLRPEKTRKTLVANLRFAASAFERENICLVIEPINNQDLPGYPISRTKDALDLIKEVNHPNVWFEYDIYHQQITEGNLTKTIRDNIDRIVYIQLADNPGRHEPGTGEINFTNLLRFIEETGYDGWIGCEYKPVGVTEDGLEWIRPYLESSNK